LLQASNHYLQRGTMTTAEEETRKGDHNVISLFIVETLGQIKFWKVIAPYYCEFFGAMMLTLVIQLSAGQNHMLAPLAIGAVLMSMIFTYGHLSGGHFNPAVSLAAMVRGKLSIVCCLLYIVAQVVGAISGSAIGYWALPSTLDSVKPGYADGEEGSAFVLELIFTFALATTVLNTATTVSCGENSFYGLAIGFVVLSGAVSTGSISGAVFNPAVGTGLLAVAGEGRGLWLYWLGPMTGGFLAGVMFHIVNTGENDVALGKPAEMEENLLMS